MVIMVTDATKPRLVFFSGAWMAKYAGFAKDRTQGGGNWDEKHEVYNFAPHRGRYFGFVHPTGSETIRLERLGSDERASYLDGVTVVWLASRPKRGTSIVGWYRNARLYRHAQLAPVGAKRELRGGHQATYYATCKAIDAVLLDPDERTFSIPRSGPGTKGYSHVWYADHGPGLHTAARARALINKFSRSQPLNVTKGPSRNPDPVQRAKVELAAINKVWEWYARQYAMKDVQRENVGWDLEARLDREVLRLEVKGLTSRGGTVELTPNEWKQMNSRKHRESYRLCVVTDALSATARLRRYRYEIDSGTWLDQDDKALEVQELASARCYL